MQKKSSHKIKYFIIGTLCLILPAGWLLANTINDKVMFYSVLELVKREYVQEVDDKTLIESALNGMLTNLDPHSSFLNQKEFDEMKTMTKGEFGGIGIEIMVDQGGLRIISPIDDTPAFKAKLQPGDIIFAINEELVSNMSPSDAISKMRGPKGTKVKISIIRSGEAEPIEVTLTRAIINVTPVKSHLYQDIGYIRVSSFSNKTTDSIKKAIKEIKEEAKGKTIKGYVIDLRNNPGGLLEQAVQTADLFLDQGVIVSTRGRDEKEHMVFKAEPSTSVEDTPLVVLINNGTASAPEIVAGALQDNKRAVIVGTKSFGKGSVQTVMPLPEYGAIRLTTALYYTPSGRSIQAEGIVPDIIVEPAKIESLKQKDQKFLFTEANLRNHLLNKTKTDDPDSNNKKVKESNLKKDEIWNKLYEEDYQLARAIDVLKSIQVLKNWQ